MNTQQIRYVRMAETEAQLEAAKWIRLGAVTWEYERDWCKKYSIEHPNIKVGQTKIKTE